MQSYFSQPDDSSEDKTRKTVEKIGIPLASLLIAVLGIFAMIRTIPVLALVVVCAYLVGLLTIIFAPPTKRFLASTFSKWDAAKIQKKIYPELGKSIEEFGSFFEFNKLGAMPQLLLDLNNMGALTNEPFSYGDDRLTIMKDWYDAIKGHLKLYSAPDFSDLCIEFGTLTIRFHEFSRKLRDALQRIVDSGKLDRGKVRNVKEKWDAYRDGHNRQMKEWESLAKEIHQRLSINCHYFYDPLVALDSSMPS